MFIKSRDAWAASKREDGVEFLMDRYNISSKDELYDSIRKSIPSDAETLIKKLEKKHKRFCNRHENAQEPQVPVDESADTSESEVEDIDVVLYTVEDLESNPNSKVEIEYPNLSVEELKAQETELSDALCELEGAHKNLVAERRELCEEIAKAKRAIEELIRLAGAQNERVQALLTRYYACDDEMMDNIANQRVYRELLDETRAQIEESEKIMIFFYQNGTIEVDNADVPAISDEEIVLDFAQLMSNQFAGDITINELKGIAKLQKMVNIYTEGGKRYELVFDNTKVQKVWETIHV